MIAPFRLYSRRAPIRRGRGRIQAIGLRLVNPAIDWHADVTVALPSGGIVLLPARSDMGRVVLGSGAFEPAELRAAISYAGVGSTVIDVGANVGLFTVALSRAVGPSGHVIAFEPIQSTVGALQENVARNHLANVHVIVAAAVEQDGGVDFNLSDDAALHSLGRPIEGHPILGSTRVAGRSLDSVWQDFGRPQVSLLKIDAEGAESRVLAGAVAIVEACSPVILVEANGQPQLDTFIEKLPRTYLERPAKQFEPWNHILAPPTERV